MFPRLLSRALGALLVLGAVFFIVRRLASGQGYRHIIEPADLIFLALAIGLVSLCVLIYGFTSCALLGWLAPQKEPYPGRLRLFFYTWLLRYIPGTVPFHASRILLADRLGVTKFAVAAGLLYENILLLGAAGLVGLTGLLIGFGLDGSSYVPYLAAGVLIACSPVLVQPQILLPISSRLLTMVGKNSIEPGAVLSTPRTLAVFSVYCFTHCLQGFAFYLVVVSISSPAPNLPLVAGSYVLAAGVGTIALFAPSGLGVREGVVVALLAGVMSSEAALLAAGLARLVSIAADLIPAGLTFAIDLGKSVRHHERRMDSRINLSGSETGQR